MKLFIEQLKALSAEPDFIARLANISAFLNETLTDINWIGFYLLKKDTLVLGPFQGKVACTRILLTQGVCGKCAREKQTILVDDVHQFEGHIACDSRTNSEIVVPIISKGQLIGVLDVDSISFNRFTQKEKELLETAAQIIGNSCNDLSVQDNV